MENILSVLDQQGFGTAPGVVLHRRIAGEGDLLLTLFLKGVGMIRVSARGAAGGKVRFGGGTEPLVWGNFGLYRGRGGSCHLKSVDVADDFLTLRGRPEPLFAAIRWAKLLMRHLMAEHAADDLLTSLYWDMKLLDRGDHPVDVVEFHFLWRWLKNWGLAPDLTACVRCGARLTAALWTGDGLYCEPCAPPGEGWALSDRELLNLRAVAGLKASAPAAWNERSLSPSGNLFATAKRRLESLLMEV
ncbi:MAG: DNA repair protein RecO [Synergistaceae bacterium]|jgi:DNA repair protein RecO (recombination protein O)|nr:DNA repair protein RecO [Synergistaceae bacterium]